MSTRESSNDRRLLLLALVSCVLIGMDKVELGLLNPVRSALATAVSPIQHMTESPYRATAYVGEFFSSHTRLRRRNTELERESLRLQGIATRYQAVLEENDRLRQLFDSRTRLRSDVLIAELIAVVPDSSRHEIFIDKGRSSGVEVGHAVIDSTGVFGQVVATTPVTSRVLLVSDTTHAVPVQVVRNNLRTIAAGTGSVSELVLKEVSVTADIREGDTLVTSGLGGRFPFGYPVGVVGSVVRDQTQRFAEVTAEPSAMLEASRDLLVILPGEPADAVSGQTASPEETRD